MKNYDHYIALDWAQSNMALAHSTKDSGEIKTLDGQVVELCQSLQ